MKNSAIVRLVALFLFLMSCRSNTAPEKITNAEDFASKYCDCMEGNGASKDFLHALKTCDSDFIKRNRFFRLYKTELVYLETAKKLSYQTKDSVFKFMRIVDSCTRSNCCESTANCPGATR